MQPYEILKKARIDKKYSIETLSDITGIKPRSLTYYEAGQRALDSLMVYKALLLFESVDINPEEMFDECLSYKQECRNKIEEWRNEHPRNYNYSFLRHQAYQNIAHLKYRKTITDEQYNMLMCYYRETFDYIYVLLGGRNGEKELSDKIYEEDYLPFMYKSKLCLYKTKEEAEPLNTVLEVYLCCEYSAATFSFLTKDFSDLMGYSNIKKLRKILSGELGLENLSIIAALRLCYILNFDFAEIFNLSKNTFI